MSQSFYHAFEQSFRGSREEIGGRLERAYGAFLRAIADHSPGAKVLDLGCGRGEWLELAQAFGLSAHGVDLDKGMLADCISQGLSVTHGDAIEHLKGYADGSLAIVSGFHIAEHLPFEVLQQVFQEALRTLQPGGLLILETPNAENIHVGGLSFHMDPTHNKPLPPGLVSFLGRHYGFARAEILRLQENDDLRTSGRARLLDVISGVSPDYALVAQKAGPDGVMRSVATELDRDRGLTLETLSDRFEQTIEHRSVERAKSELHEQLDHQLEDLRNLQREQDRRLAEQDLRLVEQERRFAEQERRFDEKTAELRSVYESTSWRISTPVRAAGQLVRRTKGFTRRALRQSVGIALKMPGTLWLARKLKYRFPVTFERAQRLIFGNLQAGQSAGLAFHQSLDQHLLSPRAANLYRRLTELSNNDKT